jgi:hypothetical protein
MPAEWGARQLLFTASAPGPSGNRTVVAGQIDANGAPGSFRHGWQTGPRQGVELAQMASRRLGLPVGAAKFDLTPVEAIDPRPGVDVFGIAPLKAIRAPVLSCRKTALRLSSSIAQAWRQRVLTLIRPVVGAGKCCRTAHDTHQRSRNGGKAVSHSQLHCSKQPLRRYHGCRLVSQVEGPGGGYAGLNRQ